MCNSPTCPLQSNYWHKWAVPASELNVVSTPTSHARLSVKKGKIKTCASCKANNCPNTPTCKGSGNWKLCICTTHSVTENRSIQSWCILLHLISHFDSAFWKCNQLWCLAASLCICDNVWLGAKIYKIILLWCPPHVLFTMYLYEIWEQKTSRRQGNPLLPTRSRSPQTKSCVSSFWDKNGRVTTSWVRFADFLFWSDKEKHIDKTICMTYHRIIYVLILGYSWLLG